MDLPLKIEDEFLEALIVNLHLTIQIIRKLQEQHHITFDGLKHIIEMIDSLANLYGSALEKTLDIVQRGTRNG